MRRSKTLILTAIVASLLLFNVVAFVVPHVPSLAFWAGYVFSTIAILAQAVSFRAAYGQEPEGKMTFMGLSLVQLGGFYLVLQLVVSLASMFTSVVPAWATVVVSSALLAGYVLTSVSAVSSRERVEELDDSFKRKTHFVRLLALDIKNLEDRIQDPTLRAAVSSLAETVRFSDPVSAGELSELETRISERFVELERVASEGHLKAATILVGEIDRLLAERSRRCKLLK